jgi:glycosyltransferase involved in cell wall biosynthesis
MKRDIFVAVAGKKGRLLDAFAGLGCPVYELDFIQDSSEPVGDSQEKLIDLIKKIILVERITIVHGHQVPSGRLAQIAASQMNVPFVFTVHGTYYNPEFLNLLKLGDVRVISVSPAVQRMLSAYGVPSAIIPNGIDTREFAAYHPVFKNHLRKKLDIPEQAKVVLYAGRLSWEKADICRDLINACLKLVTGEHPDLFLLVAGGGKRMEEMILFVEEKCKEIGKRFVRLDGEVLDMRTYYSICDCVIGTGRVALEALTGEKPLIAVGTKGGIGIVAPHNYEMAWDCWFGDHESEALWSAEMLARQIEHVFTMPFAEKDQILQEGKRWVTERFMANTAAEQLLDVYRNLLVKYAGGRLSSQ